MAETTIEWTATRKADGTMSPGFTFNPWWGCVKVSEACRNCYALTFDKRVGGAHWGTHAPRRFMKDEYWNQPVKWNRVAEKEGVRHKVFCASMADVFEQLPPGHPQIEEMDAARLRLFKIIDATPNLDWLLLTKRPENIKALWPFGWYDDQFTWENVWIGTTVEDQKTASERIPHLLRIPAKVRFLSCEPLLGPVNLTDVKITESGAVGCDPLRIEPTDRDRAFYGIHGRIHWVIAGGESGHGARPMHPDWSRSIRDQCGEAGTKFFFKQWGEWAPNCLCDSKRECQTIERPSPGTRGVMFRCGKKHAGRVLDGRTWDEMPDPKP